MVTPFPQMVCTQALFNVIGERYANVPDQVIRYVLGRFGRPTAPIDPDVIDRILTGRALAARLGAAAALAGRAAPRSPGVSDEELLRAHARRAGGRDARRRAGAAALQPCAPAVSALAAR